MWSSVFVIFVVVCILPFSFREVAVRQALASGWWFPCGNSLPMKHCCSWVRSGLHHGGEAFSELVEAGSRGGDGSGHACLQCAGVMDGGPTLPSETGEGHHQRRPTLQVGCCLVAAFLDSPLCALAGRCIPHALGPAGHSPESLIGIDPQHALPLGIALPHSSHSWRAVSRVAWCGRCAATRRVFCLVWEDRRVVLDGVSVDCGVVVQSLAGMVQYALTSPLSFFLAVDELIKEHAGFRDHFLQQ